MAEVRVLRDPAAVARAAALLFVESAAVSIAQSGEFVVVLAGGSTPTAMFQTLADPSWADRISWDLTHVYWSDERCVAPGHPDSNFGVASAALLEHVPIPESQVHRIEGEDDPITAADRYNEEIEALVARRAGTRPFDLLFLGLGEDGHTASLFPDSEAYEIARARVPGQWVLPAHVPHLEAHRITLSLLALESSEWLVFSATGEAKADAFARATGAPDPRIPASQIQSSGAVIWLVDEAAAAAA